MIQGSLFGQEMAKLAADKAGAEWKKQALSAFVDYATKNDTFTTEDVRLANDYLGEPPDNRAWGYIATAAKKQGVVRKEGYAHAVSKNVHGSIISLWKSQVYND